MNKQKLKERVKVSQADFFKYLVATDGKKFAQASISRGCPLNRYISELLNMDKDRVQVLGNDIAIDNPDGSKDWYTAPKWMAAFVAEIDKKFGTQTVNGYDCIPVLQQATRKRFTVEAD